MDVCFLIYDVDQVLKVWNYSNTFDKIYSASMLGILYYSFILDIAYCLSIETFTDNKKVYWNHKHQSQRGNK